MAASFNFPLFHIPSFQRVFFPQHFLFELSIAILAALSLDNLLKSKQKILAPIAVISVLYFLLTVITVFFRQQIELSP